MTRELLKTEIEKVRDEDLSVLYRIIVALEQPAALTRHARQSDETWQAFIANTYGCLAQTPIERGDQGTFEVRESLQ